MCSRIVCERYSWSKCSTFLFFTFIVNKTLSHHTSNIFHSLCFVFAFQGGDHGPQYRSAIYTYDDDQYALATSSKAAYEKALGECGCSDLLL